MPFELIQQALQINLDLLALVLLQVLLHLHKDFLLEADVPFCILLSCVLDSTLDMSRYKSMTRSVVSISGSIELDY